MSFRPWIPILLFISSAAFAQTPRVTKADARLAGAALRVQLEMESPYMQMKIRNVGPTVMSGRVVDLAVNPDRPSEFYVAYASGGLWRTANNGQSFVPIFENQAVMSIGDIEVDWKSGRIWVGTGENNSSRSSYSGVGMFRSDDTGRSWQHLGLPESHHIGRIRMHPTNPDLLWVGVIGHLYSDNPERGVYRTENGGQTWERTLFVDAGTGIIDLVVDPDNPDVLYAAAWERSRRAWDFKGSGPGSGIYKSMDGGKSWKLMTTPGSGFATGEGVGRIGLAISHQNCATIYAFVDDQSRRPEVEKDETKAFRNSLRTMGRDDFLAVADSVLDKWLKDEGFPKKYNAASVKKRVRNNDIRPLALVEFLEDANAQLFDTPVKGGMLYKSTDGGVTWSLTHDGYLDDLVFSYGYYFGNLQIDPSNDQTVYAMGVPILRSDDGGETFRSINGDNVHVDHHALWVNPRDGDHLINGNDGGINMSYDGGKHWSKLNSPTVGQFYTVAVDSAQPYRIYGGLQDNGVWRGPSTYKAGDGWQGDGRYPYERLLGGDGMQIAVSPKDNQTVYTGYQFGNYFRIEPSGRYHKLPVHHELGERPNRFNWQTPLHLSAHNPDILYFASQRFHRSMDGGDRFETLSPDLTKGGREGNVPFGTATSISESPRQFGLLYVGTDDGMVHVSRDAGQTFTKVSSGLPPNLWVSRVEASAHVTGRAYVALNGYRNDHFDAYIYTTEDYGRTWRRLGRNLPQEPVNVIREDAFRKGVLYVGTDHGLYISEDNGEKFYPVGPLPGAPVHDMVIQRRERELVIGTHGRSIFIMSLAELAEMNDSLGQLAIHAFGVDEVKWRESWGNSWSQWMPTNPPKAELAFYAKEAGDVAFRVLTDSGQVLYEDLVSAAKGYNYYDWELFVQNAAAIGYPSQDDKPADDGRYYVRPGEYTLEFRMAGGLSTRKLKVVKP